jgi:uncharacterized protein with von Willebrand factor type A (vWA) domain
MSSNIVRTGATLSSLKGRGLADIIRQRTGRPVLLLDRSGSMGSGTKDPEKSRWEALNDIVASLPGNLRKFIFSDTCKEVSSLRDMPSGGTRLASAFSYVKSEGIRHIILITDGEPTEPTEQCVNEARGLKIDIFYVGPSDEPPEVLKRIARQCGGQFNSVDLVMDQALLVSSIRGLLGGAQ